MMLRYLRALFRVTNEAEGNPAENATLRWLQKTDEDDNDQ